MLFLPRVGLMHFTDFALQSVHQQGEIFEWKLNSPDTTVLPHFAGVETSRSISNPSSDLPRRTLP